MCSTISSKRPLTPINPPLNHIMEVKSSKKSACLQESPRVKQDIRFAGTYQALNSVLRKFGGESYDNVIEDFGKPFRKLFKRKLFWEGYFTQMIDTLDLEVIDNAATWIASELGQKDNLKLPDPEEVNQILNPYLKKIIADDMDQNKVVVLCMALAVFLYRHSAQQLIEIFCKCPLILQALRAIVIQNKKCRAVNYALMALQLFYYRDVYDRVNMQLPLNILDCSDKQFFRTLWRMVQRAEDAAEPTHWELSGALFASKTAIKMLMFKRGNSPQSEQLSVDLSPGLFASTKIDVPTRSNMLCYGTEYYWTNYQDIRPIRSSEPYYFEVCILSQGPMRIGISHHLTRMEDWNEPGGLDMALYNAAVGIDPYEGYFYSKQERQEWLDYEGYLESDVFGCYVNSKKKKIVFTHNGKVIQYMSDLSFNRETFYGTVSVGAFQRVLINLEPSEWKYFKRY